jgi:hypothetical protein
MAETMVWQKSVGLGRLASNTVTTEMKGAKKIVPINDHVIEQLKAAYPTVTNGMEWVADIETEYHELLAKGEVEPFSDFDERGIQKWFETDRGKSTGTMKIDSNIIAELIKTPGTGPRIAETFVLLFQQFAKNPTTFREWHSHHKLLAIERTAGQGTDNPRFLHPQSTISRCFKSLTTDQLRAKLPEDFATFAIGTKAGTEKMAASAKAVLQQGGSVWVADVRKAYPTTDLKVVATEIMRLCPSYIPIFLGQYGVPYKNFATAAGVVLTHNNGLATADAESPILFTAVMNRTEREALKPANVTHNTYIDDSGLEAANDVRAETDRAAYYLRWTDELRKRNVELAEDKNVVYYASSRRGQTLNGTWTGDANQGVPHGDGEARQEVRREDGGEQGRLESGGSGPRNENENEHGGEDGQGTELSRRNEDATARAEQGERQRVEESVERERAGEDAMERERTLGNDATRRSDNDDDGEQGRRGSGQSNGTARATVTVRTIDVDSEPADGKYPKFMGISLALEGEGKYAALKSLRRPSPSDRYTARRASLRSPRDTRLALPQTAKRCSR